LTPETYPLGSNLQKSIYKQEIGGNSEFKKRIHPIFIKKFISEIENKLQKRIMLQFSNIQMVFKLKQV
jgi:hypothetical protein